MAGVAEGDGCAGTACVDGGLEVAEVQQMHSNAHDDRNGLTRSIGGGSAEGAEPALFTSTRPGLKNITPREGPGVTLSCPVGFMGT